MTRHTLIDNRKSFKNGVQFGWDATSFDSWQRCPKYYQLVIVEGWTPNRARPDLWFGGEVATAFETYHKFRAEGQTHDDAVREVFKITLSRTWDYEKDQPIDFEDTVKSRFNLLRSIVWYLDHFENDTLKTIILANNKPAVELSFAIEFGDDIMWSGHIDRMVEYSGDVYITDNKTSKNKPNAKYWKDWNLNNQMSGYTYAGRVLWALEIKGVIIDALEIKEGGTIPHRNFTFRNDAQLDEWRENTLYEIAQARKATEDNHFSRNYTSCTKYFGCDFFDYCALPPQNRRAFLHTNYHQREELWDPLEAR